MKHNRIITVGFAPAWDVTCSAAGLDWGDHVPVDQRMVPAGKALNVSKALAWLGHPSMAMGLWGQEDRPQLASAQTLLGPAVDIRMTFVPGRTRLNLTVVDTSRRREMHLRAPSTLATAAALDRLMTDILPRLDAPCTVVFSGALPEGDLQGKALDIVAVARRAGAHCVADSAGTVLQAMLQQGRLHLIKPNLEELREWLSAPVPNNPPAIMDAIRSLENPVDIALVSRGKEGALVVTADEAWSAQVTGEDHPVVNTVACGDYLLAGFLAGPEDEPLPRRIQRAVQVATARARGWTDRPLDQALFPPVDVQAVAG